MKSEIKTGFKIPDPAPSHGEVLGVRGTPDTPETKGVTKSRAIEVARWGALYVDKVLYRISCRKEGAVREYLSEWLSFKYHSAENQNLIARIYPEDKPSRKGRDARMTINTDAGPITICSDEEFEAATSKKGEVVLSGGAPQSTTFRWDGLKWHIVSETPVESKPKPKPKPVPFLEALDEIQD